jgi:hypothetical protein
MAAARRSVDLSRTMRFATRLLSLLLLSVCDDRPAPTTPRTTFIPDPMTTGPGVRLRHAALGPQKLALGIEVWPAERLPSLDLWFRIAPGARAAFGLRPGTWCGQEVSCLTTENPGEWRIRRVAPCDFAIARLEVWVREAGAWCIDVQPSSDDPADLECYGGTVRVFAP